jgi:tetratricopeptide (TPR) repeat protein
MSRRLRGAALAAVWVVGVCLVPGVSRAQEDGEDPPAPVERANAEPGERRARFVEVLRAIRKMRAGEELTDEEKKLLAEAREQRKVLQKRLKRAERERRKAVAHRRSGGADGRLRYDGRLNVIDQAYFQIAEIHLGQDEHEQAVAALERLVQKSPDKRAVSLAHLNLAELYRSELNLPAKAVAEYKQVTGEFAAPALRRLAELFEELGQVDQAVEQFDALAKSTADATTKILALRELAELLVRNHRPGEAVAVLQRLTRAVSYEEAAKITKSLREAQERNEDREQEERERVRLRTMKAWERRIRERFAEPDRGRRPPRPRGPADAPVRPLPPPEPDED